MVNTIIMSVPLCWSMHNTYYYRFGQLEREVASAFESHTSSSCSDQLQSSQRGVAKYLLEKMKCFLYSDIDTIPRVIVSA